MIGVIPHADNGRKCICGRPVYWTGTAWTDRKGRGSHRQPKPRT